MKMPHEVVVSEGKDYMVVYASYRTRRGRIRGKAIVLNKNTRGNIPLEAVSEALGSAAERATRTTRGNNGNTDDN